MLAAPLEGGAHLGHRGRGRPTRRPSAARWLTLATFDVACDWRLVAALITSCGPIIHPTRQPVMA